MLTLSETLEIQDKLKIFEGESTEFTDQQLDDAEFYHLRLDLVSFQTVVTLYNAAEEPLGSVSFEDADVAIAFLEELFDLDPEDMEDLENYSWASEESFDSIDTEAQTVNNID